MDIRQRLGLATVETSIESAIIVLEVEEGSRDSHMGVLVDSVQEVVRLDEGSIEASPKVGNSGEGQMIGGMGKRNGEFVLLLQMENLFSSEELDAAVQKSDADLVN